MNELKPCPFCGGNASIQVERDLDNGSYYRHYIFCDDCGAEMSAELKCQPSTSTKAL